MDGRLQIENTLALLVFLQTSKTRSNVVLGAQIWGVMYTQERRNSSWALTLGRRQVSAVAAPEPFAVLIGLTGAVAYVHLVPDNHPSVHVGVVTRWPGQGIAAGEAKVLKTYRSDRLLIT